MVLLLMIALWATGLRAQSVPAALPAIERVAQHQPGLAAPVPQTLPPIAQQQPQGATHQASIPLPHNQVAPSVGPQQPQEVRRISLQPPIAVPPAGQYQAMSTIPPSGVQQLAPFAQRQSIATPGPPVSRPPPTATAPLSSEQQAIANSIATQESSIPAPYVEQEKPTVASSVTRLITLQPPAAGSPEADRTQGEQRIRDLEGLGPAPGTTSADENRSSGAVPNKPTVAWTGELQTDVVGVRQSEANIAELGQLKNFSDFRRARLGAFGSLYANTIYRLEFDFALQGRPSFLDVYGQLTDQAIVGNIRIGHFFEPFSLARLTSNRYQEFMERPLLDAFAPSRNLGIMAFDTYNDKRGTWQIGLFGADSNDNGEEQTNRGGEAVTGRMTYLPFWDEPSDGRYFMHLGGCFSYRAPAQQTARFGYWPGFRPGSFDNIVWPRWVDTGLIAANQVTLLDAEWAWVMGPWHVQAEYAANFVNQINGPNLAFSAWYVETGYFLTGESRTYQQEMAIFNRVTPLESFFFVRTKDGLRGGRGAWQVAFRIDDLNVSDQNIQGGRLVNLTLGLNWHLNPYTRMYFNYVHAMLDRNSPSASYGNLVGLRAQFEF